MNTKIFTKREMLSYMRDFSGNSLEKIPRDTWNFIKSKLLDAKCLTVEVDFKNNQITFLNMLSCPICSCYDDVAPFLNYIKMKFDNKTTIDNCAASAVASVADACVCSVDLSNKVNYYTVADTSSSSVDYSYITTKLSADKKENKNMNGINFDFGKVTSDAVRLSLYGIAVKSVNGNYVSYDPKSHSIMDVEIVNMPVNGMLYKIPVAIKDIKAGDVIIHNKVPMFVVEVHESTVKVIDIREGAEKEIYLTKNIFNFNFATKVVSVMDMMGPEMKPSADQPFGNPIMMMMLMGSDKMDDMLPLILMNGNTAMNPMMVYLLMNNKDSKMDPMLMLAMMNVGTFK